MSKVKARGAERRAAEKRLLRGANKQLRATTSTISLAATVIGLKPLNLDAKMHAAAASADTQQAPEQSEPPDERPVAQIAAASKLRSLKRTRDERERAATFATLRARWMIASSNKERRQIERSSQWRESFAPATRTTPRGSEASERERENVREEGDVPPELAVPSDREEEEGAAETGAPVYIPLFGEDADEASEQSILEQMAKIDESCMLYERGEGVFKPRPSSASSAPAPAASVLFGDDADACAKIPAPPLVAGGFVQPLFGDDCNVHQTSSMSGASIASDSGASGGSASGVSSANVSSVNVSAVSLDEGAEGDEQQVASSPFQGVDAGEKEKVAKVADQILSGIARLGFTDKLMSWGAEPQLGLMRRVQKAKRRLLKASFGQVTNMRRAVTHLAEYLESNEMSETCSQVVAADTLIDSIEEYDDSARAKAKARADKRSAKNLPPRRNDRGGATATMPIFLGYVGLEKKLGLPIEASAQPEVKAAAKAGPGMPAVQPMMNLKTADALGLATLDMSKSAFERAYAGGGWLLQSSSTRVIDLQRTPKISFEKSKVCGTETTIACGIAKRSKARGQLEMRPLAWRAPLIPLSGEDIDLAPLIDSMPDSEEGCVFRDFITPPGAAHTIDNAIGWANTPASHDTVVNSLRVVGDDPTLSGHMGRHVNAEIGRALGLPRHVREAIGYWRVQPVVSDSTNDAAAIARATTKARERRTRAGALASCADRYASVDAQAVEQDQARVACQLAARELFKDGADMVPATTREQIEAIAAACSGE